MKGEKWRALENECVRFDLLHILEKYRNKLQKNKNPKIHHLAWVVYSDYLLLSKSEGGKCVCVTCGCIKDWYDSYMHPGHFLEAGKSLKRKFVDDNVRPQCYSCNVAMHGNYKKYTLFMQEKFGNKWVEKLLNDKDTHTIKNYEYADMIKKWYKKIEHLLV